MCIMVYLKIKGVRMKQVVVIEDNDSKDLEDKINIELKKWDSDSTELQFSSCINEYGVMLFCMITIKDVS